jgi:hypothetical protein
MTYYGTGAGGTGFTAMDVSDPANPKLIGHFADDIDSTHDISISQDGKRAYLTRWGNFVPFGLPGPNGLVILDTSNIQNRVAGAPPPRLVGSIYWDDGGTAQETMPSPTRASRTSCSRRMRLRRDAKPGRVPRGCLQARDLPPRVRPDH